MSNPFDYVKDILQPKKNLIVDEITEKSYKPFLVNKGLSFYRLCIFCKSDESASPFRQEVAE